MPEAVLPLPAPGLELERVRREAGAIVVELRATAAIARCPTCGHTAARVHSRYRRTLADLPCQGVPVRLRVHVRRFRCDRADCTRAMFTERIPALALPYARRTLRQSQVLTHVGVMLGGEAAVRLLPKLGLAGSADTVLRLVHRSSIPPAPPPRIVGVDDWAIRRGHTYGTIIVDLERHAPVDLLADRTADALRRWLEDHPGVAVVARDRAEAYAQGAREGAPHAIQVADRWHLLKNAGEALERVLQRNRVALHQAAKDASTEVPRASPAEDENLPPRTVDASEDAGAEQQARACAVETPRQALYEQVHALRAQGLSIDAIGGRIGLSRPTVRKYLRADACPERAPRRTKIGAGTDYDSFLRARWAEGCHDAVVLWNELKERSFRGTLRTVQRHVATWRSGDELQGSVRRGDAGATLSPAMRPPSPRELRWWLLPTNTEQPLEQVRYVERLVTSCPAIATAQRLAQRFADIVRARDAPALAPWLEEAETSSLPEFRDFATGLRRDAAAVEAALIQVWSNGQTEGQVTRLKMLKRQMYGRASVPLLRQRLLLAA
jgi:transposase